MRYTNISDLYRQVQERKLTPQELEDREKIAKKLPMDDFKKRYGKDAMAVKMAVATNIAKGKSEEIEEDAKMGKQSDDNLKSLMKKFRDMEKKDPKMPSTQFMIKKIGKEMKKRGLKEEIDIQEDGHQDIPSAIRQCKTITEDAMQIMGKLKSMSGEDSLPTWWTNKLAVASNSINKMRDYLLVPSDGMNEQLQEAMGDMEDLKKVVAELQNASKMHLAQSKRVQAHVDMMKDAGMDKKENIDELFGISSNANHRSKTIKMLDGMNIKYEKSGRNGLVIKGVPKNKQQDLLNKIKKDVGMYNTATKEELEITSKELLDNKFKEEKNGAQHFSKVNEDNYVWNFVYDDFGRTKLTTEPDKATHLVYTMEGKDNPQLLKISEKEILDYKKGEINEVSKK